MSAETVIANLHKYFDMYDGVTKHSTADGSEFINVLNKIFHPKYTMVVDGEKTMDREDVMKILCGMLESGKYKAEDVMIKKVDETKVEYTLKLTLPDGKINHPHSIGTIQDGMLIRTEPFDKSQYKYFLDSKSVLEVTENLKPYFSLYDGVTKQPDDKINEVFGKIFHPDYVLVMDDKEMSRDSALAVFRGMLQGGATKAENLEIITIGENKIDYSITLTLSGGEKKTPRSIGTIKDGKLIRTEPFDMAQYSFVLGTA